MDGGEGIKKGFTLAGSLLFLLAIALQIQITFFKSEDYLGLRISGLELSLPFAACAILFSLFSRKSEFPVWKLPYAYHWVTIITAVLTFAFFHTWFLFGETSRWALVNKYGGWFALLGIAGMGGWLGSNAKPKELQVFLKTLIYFSVLIFLYQSAVLILQCFESTRPWLGYNKYAAFPMEGMMKNRNAFALLMTAVYALATCFYFSDSGKMNKYLVCLLFFLWPTFLVFNASRAGFFAFCFLFPALLLLHRNQFKKYLVLIIAVFLGWISVYAVIYKKQDQIFILKNRPYELLEDYKQHDTENLVSLGEKVSYPGDSMRLTILNDALEMIKKRPLQGSGLGSAMLYQKEKHGKAINLIDSTPIWLLVETGIIGLFVFATFYICVVKSIYKSMKESEGIYYTFRLSMIMIIACFSIMCLFHEIFYARHMWFLLGLTLALPLKTRHPE
jgi:O-antigen ligase